MTNLIKGAAIFVLAAMGLSLSACGSESANASATPTSDPAEQTAASIDSSVPAPVPAPSDAAAAEKAPAAVGEKAAH
jgi:hypothetical protein